MIRFSKRSRSLSFAGASVAPATSHASASKSEVSSLWRDGSRVSALSSSDLVSDDDDVIDVDHEAVEVIDDAPRSSAQPARPIVGRGATAAPPSVAPASLPPPRMPPRRLTAPEPPTSHDPRRAAMRSVPPTSFAPLARTESEAPASSMKPAVAVRGAKVPTPRPPPRRTTPSIVQSVSPVAMDNDAAPESTDAPPRSSAPAARRRRGVGKPSWPFAAALVLVGATFGFAASMFAHPSYGSGASAGAATLTADSTQVTEVVGKAAVPPPAEAKALTFSDTPLDIRVPAAPKESTSAEPAPAIKVSAVLPAVAAPTPVIKPSAPASPAPASTVGSSARPAKAEPKIIELPSREQREARERDAMRVTKPTAEPAAAAPAPANPPPTVASSPASPRRDLSPAAVDALVRQQLSSALH